MTASAFTPDELAEAARFRLEIQWFEADDAFLVALPELDGVRAHAPTIAAAAERGVELAAEHLAAMRALGLPAPAPRGVAVGS